VIIPEASVRRRVLLRAATAFVFLGLAAPAIAAPPPDSDKKRAPYALIFGTVYGPDDRPIYGVPVKIRRADKKKAQYELMSDHRGEFAQRVPPGPADYIVWTDARLQDGSKKDKKQKAKGPDVTDEPSPSGHEAKVHINSEERVDVGLHLRE
jgi:hypothetical protein